MLTAKSASSSSAVWKCEPEMRWGKAGGDDDDNDDGRAETRTRVALVESQQALAAELQRASCACVLRLPPGETLLHALSLRAELKEIVHAAQREGAGPLDGAPDQALVTAQLQQQRQPERETKMKQPGNGEHRT